VSRERARVHDETGRVARASAARHFAHPREPNSTVGASVHDPKCLFCRIVRHEIPATILHEDDGLLAFRDINPQAPTHILIIPRQHIATLNDLGPEHRDVVGDMHLLARELARGEGVADDGWRVVMNCGAAAGQTVFHIHMHLLGGRHLGWPPG
jgi:histidine triad (HIT) family protein